MQSFNELYHDVKATLPGVRWVSYYSQVLVGDYKYSSRPQNELGWLLCNGQSLLRTDYPHLFDVIGTTFGSVDADHFSLPDFRGRVHGDVGSGPALSARAIGDNLGEETHTLTVNEMPSHNHGGMTGAAGYGTGVQSITAVAGSGIDAADNTGNHAHSINAQGGGLPHNNMQPTLFAGFTYIFSGIIM